LSASQEPFPIADCVKFAFSFAAVTTWMHPDCRNLHGRKSVLPTAARQRLWPKLFARFGFEAL
jgi:hypothetical protein